MRKWTALVLFLFFITNALLGCQTEEYSITDSGDGFTAKQASLVTNSDQVETELDQHLETNEKLQFDEDIINVSIVDLIDNSTMIFENDQSLKDFNLIFTNAAKLNGTVNMVSPNFSIAVTFTNKKDDFFIYGLVK